MKWVALCALLGAIPTIAYSTRAQGHALTLEAILRNLDNSAKDFHSLSADIDRTTVTVAVDDHSTESGTLLVRGDKMLLQMTAPDNRTILRNGDNIDVYTPGMKRVEEYNLGKNRDLADEVLLLGFGTSGKELQKGYQVKLAGETKIGDKNDVELDLTPRSATLANQASKFQLWLDQSTWLADQVQVNETSGDYITIRYTKMVRNPSIPDSKFKLQLPKGIEHIKPQG
jgi:outer membrane lipoprotein-sorting protein